MFHKLGYLYFKVNTFDHGVDYSVLNWPINRKKILYKKTNHSLSKGKKYNKQDIFNSCVFSINSWFQLSNFYFHDKLTMGSSWQSFSFFLGFSFFFFFWGGIFITPNHFQRLAQLVWRPYLTMRTKNLYITIHFN